MSFLENIYICDIDHENVFEIMHSKYLLLYFPGRVNYVVMIC